MELVRGFASPFRGALFVARHRLWSFFILPILVNLALAGVAAWLGVGYARQLFGAQLEGLAPWLVWVVLPLLGLLVGVLFFIVGQPVLSAPFIDLLSEKVESISRGRVASLGLLRSAWLAVLHGLLKVMLYLLALAVAFGLGALTGLGGVLGAALYALFLAFDGFDYPLARRGLFLLGQVAISAFTPGADAGILSRREPAVSRTAGSSRWPQRSQRWERLWSTWT